jgi:hypothetical protein
MVGLDDFHPRRTDPLADLQDYTNQPASEASHGGHRDRSSRPSMGIALAASSTVMEHKEERHEGVFLP